MPVIGTLGALTYIKGISLGPTWENFYFEISTTTTSFIETSIFDSNGNIYASGAVNNNPFSLKINSSNIFVTPSITWTRRILTANAGAGNVTQGTNSTGNILLEDNNGNIINIMKGRYFIYTGQIGDVEINTVLDSGNGIVTTPTKYYATNGYTLEYRRPTDGIIYANNFVVIGDTNLKSSNVTNNYQRYITNFYQGNGNIETQILFNTTGNAQVFLTGNINLDSSNNFIIAGGESSNGNSYTTVGNLNNSLNTINGDYNYDIEDFLDSAFDINNDFLYITGRNIANSIVTKIDNTGNVIWSKDFGNSSGSQSNPSPEIYRIHINSGNTDQLIVSGLKTGNVGNVYPIKTVIFCLHGANGEINWQNELTFTGSNTYANAYLEPNDLKTNNNSILLSGVLQKSTDVGALITLPISGQIPTNGNYNLNANLNLTYTGSNYTISNVTITKSAGNHTIISGSGSFANITLTSNTTLGGSNYFSQL